MARWGKPTMGWNPGTPKASGGKALPSGGYGDAARRQVIVNEISRQGGDLSGGALNAADRAFLAAGGSRAGKQPASPAGVPTSYTGGGGGGRGRGGGGGGGGGAAPFNTAWLAELLRASAPTQGTFSALDLPETAFDPTYYNELEGRFNQALGMDRATAQQAYADLRNNLQSSYRNAFTTPQAQNYATMGQAPGQSQQAMQRMLAAQGVNPDQALGNERYYAQGADQAFGNLLAVLGANEDWMQNQRLNRIGTDTNTAMRALDIAGLQGQAGIGLQRTQAQAEWQKQIDQIRQQEAMANWQRQNTLSDQYLQSQNQYRNEQLQALLGLMPSMGENLPTLEMLGLAPPAAAAAPAAAPAPAPAPPTYVGGRTSLLRR